MKIMAKEWFKAIKDDIIKKYQIQNPVFLVEKNVTAAEDLEKWVDVYARAPYLWLKYAYLQDAQFELLPFSPDPSDAISLKLINDSLESWGALSSSFFTINKYNIYDEDTEGVTLYNIKEIEYEMLFLLRKGYAKIELINTSLSHRNIPISHLHIEQDSLENMLETGYLQLEYFRA